MAQRLIGLDIGNNFLRAVALSGNKQQWSCDGFAEVSRYDELGQPKPLQRVLTELDSRLELDGKVTVGSSDLTTMVRFEHNQPMPPDRLERVLRMELLQHANAESGDLAADAVTIPLGGDELIHCCGLAQPAQVNELLVELEEQNISAYNVDLAMAAGANAVATSDLEDGHADKFGLVIDIGSRCTRLLLMRGSDFLACRQLSIGGDQFTEALAKLRNLELSEAERIKRAQSKSIAEGGHDDVSENSLDLVGDDPDEDWDSWIIIENDSEDDEGPAAEVFMVDSPPVVDQGLGLSLDDSALTFQDDDTSDTFLSFDDNANETVNFGASPEPLLEDGFMLDEPDVVDSGSELSSDGGTLSPEMRSVAEQLNGQIAKSVAWFQSQLRLRQLPVEWVQLAGGGSQLAGLGAYLGQRLKVSVSTMDPFATMEGDCPPTSGHVYALALGLARSELPNAVQFHLVPESVQRKRLFWQQIVWPRIAAGFLAAATLIMAIGLWRSESSQQERAELYRRHAQSHQELMSQLDQAVAQRDGLLEDLKSVASRILGGRDLLYAIRALKQKAPRELWLTEMSTDGVETNVTTTSVSSRRGGRSSAQPTVGPQRAESRTDTLITSLRLAGYIRPSAGQENIDQLSIFDRWYNELLDWTEDEDALTLFSEHDVIEFPIEQSVGEGSQYRFEILLHLRPTSWEEVTDRSQAGGQH